MTLCCDTTPMATHHSSAKQPIRDLTLLKREDDLGRFAAVSGRYVEDWAAENVGEVASESMCGNETGLCIPPEECHSIPNPARFNERGTLISTELQKGSFGGLGFSITTRDNHDGPNIPIYIKNILPEGAAIKNGELRPGDRIIQVDDVVMSGKSLSEATAILRNIEINTMVRLLVSRQKKSAPTNKTCLPSSKIDQDSVVLDRAQDDSSSPTDELPVTNFESNTSQSIECDSQMQALPLYIRILHHGLDLCQLGVRVKRMRKKGQEGLVVRAVISGKVADKDGQLRVNDRITHINGTPLANFDKQTIIEMFRTALMQSLENDSVINVTVVRTELVHVDASPSLPSSSLAETSCLQVISSQDRSLLRCHENEDRLLLRCNENEDRSLLRCNENEDQSLLHCNENDSSFDFSSSLAENCSSDQSRYFSENSSNSADLFPSEPRFCDNCPSGGPSHQDDKCCELNWRSSEGATNLSGDDFQTEVPSEPPDSVLMRGTPDGSSCDDEPFTEKTPAATSVLIQEEEETVLNTSDTVFQRDGYGRRSVSEKRSCKSILSGSEIYRNIKESRRRRGLPIHELDSVLPESAECKDVAESGPESAVSAEIVNDSSLHRRDSIQPLHDVKSEVAQAEQTFDSSSINFVSSDNLETSSTATVSLPSEPVNSAESLNATPPSKPAKKFDLSMIRQLFKRGFAELFRPETRVEASKLEQDRETNRQEEEFMKRNVPDYQANSFRKGSSLPRPTSCRLAKDFTEVRPRFPTMHSQVPSRTSTLPTNSRGFCYSGQTVHQPARFHVQPNIRSRFSVPFIQQNVYPVATAYAGQIPVPLPSQQIRFTANSSYFCREPSCMLVFPAQCDTYSPRVVAPVRHQASWTRFGYRQGKISQKQCPEQNQMGRHFGNSEQHKGNT